MTGTSGTGAVPTADWPLPPGPVVSRTSSAVTSASGVLMAMRTVSPGRRDHSSKYAKIFMAVLVGAHRATARYKFFRIGEDLRTDNSACQNISSRMRGHRGGFPALLDLHSSVHAMPLACGSRF
jgi:hypothetical protein